MSYVVLKINSNSLVDKKLKKKFVCQPIEHILNSMLPDVTSFLEKN